MATNDTNPNDDATLVPTLQAAGHDTGHHSGQHDGAPQADDAAGAGTPAEAPAPRRRATRRTTKKATTISPAVNADPPPSGDEPTPAAFTEQKPDVSTESPTDSTPQHEAAGTAGSVPAAETKRPVRKRAARKKAEPAEALDGAPADAPTEAPKTTRRGSRSKADRASAAVEELVTGVLSGDVETPAVTPVDAPLVTGVDLSALVDLDALDVTDETDETEMDAEPAGAAGDDAAALPAAAVPSFSVLFQAPDASQAVPTRRRRGAPQPAAPEPVDEPSDDLDAHRAPVHEEADSDVADQSEERSDEQSDEESGPRRSRRRRGGKGRRGRGSDEDDTQDQLSEVGDSPDSGPSDEATADSADDSDTDAEGDTDDEGGSSRRRRRRRRSGSPAESGDDTPNVSTRVRQPRSQSDEPVAVKGSTRLEAKKQRRREGREAGRRRTVITEAEFLARREAVDRVMVVRNKDGRTQMGVLEDGVLVEHYIDQATNVSMAGNIYLGRVQNVLPSMEAAFVDIGKGRNAVLYAGEVNWDAAGLEANQPKRIENALGSGQTVLVQVTKDPIGHKGARLTSQISLPGRYLVYVPNSSMTGISRKLPDTERARLKKILREVVPESAGVIVRTAAEGASEEELRADVERLTRSWEEIQAKAEAASSPRAGKSKGKKKNGEAGSVTGGQAPMLLHGEPDLTVRVIRDVFNEDFKQLVVSGEQAWNEIHPYISSVAPDLADRLTKWTSQEDLFTHHRVDEQLSKAMDRKVWLPSGGSLVIDRTEAMTVVDVNTGKFIGSGGNLEETVTKNNIEAAEEIVRQLRLRDIGGIIVIDFIDMVLESNRELVVRRLLECLGRDRTKHQVAEVTSLGLVQMTRKRVGSGLIEVFSETCDHCNGRGFIIHTDPVDKGAHPHEPAAAEAGGSSRRRGRQGGGQNGNQNGNGQGSGGQESGQQNAAAEPRGNGPTAAQIAAAAHAAALKSASGHALGDEGTPETSDEVPSEQTFTHERPSSGHEFLGADTAFEPSGRDGVRVEPAPEPTAEPTAERTAEPTAELSPGAQPAARSRRRRGRVVAPAGPPRAINVGDQQSGAGAEE